MYAADARQEAWCVLLLNNVDQCATWARVPADWQHQKQVPVSKPFCQDLALRGGSRNCSKALHAIVSLDCVLVADGLDFEPVTLYLSTNILVSSVFSLVLKSMYPGAHTSPTCLPVLQPLS